MNAPATITPRRTLADVLETKGITPADVAKAAKALAREAHRKERKATCRLRGGPWNGQPALLTPNMGGSLVIRVGDHVGHYDCYGNWCPLADTPPARRVRDDDGRWRQA